MFSRTLLPIAILFFPLCSIAQFKTNVAAYYNNMNAAKVFVVKKDYKNAVDAFEKAKAVLLPFKEDLELASYWYEVLNDDKQAVYYFNESILNGYAADDTALYPEYYRYRADAAEVRTFIAGIDSLKKEFSRNSNVEFSLLVKELHTKDQFIRNDNLLYNKDSVIKAFAYTQLAAVDADNLDRLLQYFKNHSIPSANELSDDIISNFRILVHHHIAEQNQNNKKEELRKLVATAIYDGRLPNTFLYTALDWEHVACCKKQLYGTYTARTANRKITYDNIEDIAHVDDRRRKWLLLPLYWSMRYNFEENYQLPEGYTFKE